MLEILVITSDQSMLDDLCAESIPDLELTKMHGTLDSANGIIPSDLIFMVKITAYSVSLSLLSQWLYDRIIKRKPNKATINGQEVSKDPSQISNIINNLNIQIDQSKKGNEK